MLEIWDKGSSTKRLKQCCKSNYRSFLLCFIRPPICIFKSFISWTKGICYEPWYRSVVLERKTPILMQWECDHVYEQNGASSFLCFLPCMHAWVCMFWFGFGGGQAEGVGEREWISRKIIIIIYSFHLD